MQPDTETPSPITLGLKGSMTAHALLQVPADADEPAATRALATLLAEDGESLRHTPCILAFPERTELPDWLPDWVERLRQEQLVPFAVQCEQAADRARVHALGLADMPVPEPSFRKPRAAPRASAEQPGQAPLVIRQQVRSGQQVYARNQDLVVLASVSAGAEVMADGHIHVYGELRGRALAGVSGNAAARIWCQSLQAELVAVAGLYLLPEQLPEQRQRVEIHLQDDQLQISGQ
ncbi:septum site-determining protein MinC [Natronospirillum operosum]|uniref:Probable septum site-determining protein MinC n=1 Tax=Natronospirillum operosum TaxID=2759953 RepID=A0A4Z0W7P4_9GAMM|nr:septum site-determining protein MinC [Natronospirillum operosum]TGG92747.1 septum site-determining protein MinC [Natronospirillum operosum]